MSSRSSSDDPRLRWQKARLIPTAGIKGQEEQERRATSALLAVTGAVPEFGHALLGELGAPRGRVESFVEIQLRDGDGKLTIPDGAIVVERGNRRWRTLVEVKTGGAELDVNQINADLDAARLHGFDAVLTISNQITPSSSDSPVAVDRRKLRTVSLWHLSWWRIVTEAIIQHRFRGISDPDQAWILGELIAYLDHENSGASGFSDMGEHWVRVRDGARQGTLRVSDPEVRTVCERWEQMLDFLALGLSQDLGREVAVVRQRGLAAEQRLAALVEQLSTQGALAGTLRIPDAIGLLDVVADLRAGQVTTSATFDGPREWRPLARIRWLLRQLAGAPESLRIEVGFGKTRETTAQLLGAALEEPKRLLSPTDARREPRYFIVALTRLLGQKRGKDEGSFVRETRRQVIDFYRDVMQGMRAWQASAPKLASEPDGASPAPSEEPPAFAELDERDFGEGSESVPESLEREIPVSEPPP